MDVEISPLFVVHNHISVQAASDFMGYHPQYQRRLLRNSKIEVLRIGRVWLIEKNAFEAYLEKAIQAVGRRFGPQ